LFQAPPEITPACPMANGSRPPLTPLTGGIGQHLVLPKSDTTGFVLVGTLFPLKSFPPLAQKIPSQLKWKCTSLSSDSWQLAITKLHTYTKTSASKEHTPAPMTTLATWPEFVDQLILAKCWVFKHLQLIDKGLLFIQAKIQLAMQLQSAMALSQMTNKEWPGGCCTTATTQQNP